MFVGASLTFVTFIVNVASNVNPPASVVLTLIVYVVFTSKLKTTPFLRLPPLVNVKLLLSG